MCIPKAVVPLVATWTVSPQNGQRYSRQKHTVLIKMADLCNCFPFISAVQMVLLSPFEVVFKAHSPCNHVCLFKCEGKASQRLA